MSQNEAATSSDGLEVVANWQGTTAFDHCPPSCFILPSDPLRTGASTTHLFLQPCGHKQFQQQCWKKETVLLFWLVEWPVVTVSSASCWFSAHHFFNYTCCEWSCLPLPAGSTHPVSLKKQLDENRQIMERKGRRKPASLLLPSLLLAQPA